MHIECMVMHNVQNESLVFFYQLGLLSTLPSGENEVSQTPHSWKRTFSCCCWVGDRCSGTGGGRCGLEAAGGGGELATATTSRIRTVCPVAYASEEVQGGDYGSQPILQIHW